MKKTLYLHNTKDYIIKIDGPSLLVNKNNQSPRRIPYEYIDFVHIDSKEKINQDILREFLRFKKPAVITSLYKNDSLHIIPVSDSGYFEEIPQRIAINKKEIKTEFHTWLIEKKKQIQIYAIKSFDKNLYKALKTHSFTDKEYFYYIMKFCNNERKKFFNTRRKFKDLFIGLITAKCISEELNPEIGIINDKKRFGFVCDLLCVVDPIMDVLSAKILCYRKYKDFYNGNWLNDEGMRVTISLFEKGKPIFDRLLQTFLKEIKLIIKGKR
ncbi:MAG: hypothetical protein N2999_05345 [Proteobacteria bacterium]|nr:hypothetical protein [Pseudomonadota bacterium]